MKYFALNAMIGKGAYSVPDFPDAESLIEHLDYLGVDRTLVYSVKARDFSPIAGNRQLLEEIAPYSKRLIPSFVLTPADFFADGVMEYYREKLSSAEVRAFRLCPELSRFPVRQIERVLGVLTEYRPVVLMDSGFGTSEMDIRDLEYLATAYKRIHFVVCQKMWGGFGSVLDLMWRCPNVYLDISWLHMRDTIELVRDEFGIDRLLFGLGYKSHYGAAIGALSHAALTPREHNAIAHRNLEKLLKIPPLTEKLAVEPPLLKQKPLWNKFRNGEKLDALTVYDAHGHSGTHTRGWVLRESDPASYFDTLVSHMDRNGVDKLFLSGEEALFGDMVPGNRKLEQYARPYPERFRGYFVYNPLYKAELTTKLLDEFFSRDFWAGFKILPSYWRVKVNDPVFDPVWKYAEKHHLPVLIHTWNDQWNAPSMLAEIVKKYPNAKFLLGHSGGGTPGRLEAEQLALEYPNVYLEFCGTFCSDRSLVKAYELLGPERIIFGSDTGAHNEAYELGGLLSLPLPDKQLIPALHDNLENILKDRK
jgi:hypothetical protein